MSEQLEKIDKKLDVIDKRLSSIDITLAIQEENLRIHMLRWEASEKRLEHLEDSWMSHLGQVEGALKAMKWLGWTIGLAFVILQLVEIIK